MKWILFTGAFLPMSAAADEKAFGTPETRCLNDHTIPFINSTIPAKKVVDDAYVQCKPELDEWMKLQELLPDDMKKSMRKELYDFYIRMIEIRRKYEASKTAKTAQ